MKKFLITVLLLVVVVAPFSMSTPALAQTGTNTVDNQQLIAQLVSMIQQLMAQIRAILAQQNGGDPSTSLDPVITGVSGPNSIAVGQQGTWTIQATAPANAYLVYNVDWGDNSPVVIGDSAGSAGIPNRGTFSHSYPNAGAYTVTFSVTNNQQKGGGNPVKTSMTVVVGNQASIPVKIVDGTTYGNGYDASIRLSIAGYPSNNQVDHWVLGYVCSAGVNLDTGKGLLCDGQDSGKAGLSFYRYNMADPTSDYLMITAGAQNKNSYPATLTFSLDARDANDRSIGSPDYKTITLGGNNVGQFSINVTYPQEGTILDNSGGKALIATVRWSESNGNSPVNIYLLDQNNRTVKNIAINIPNSGSYDWPSDLSIPNGTYRIMITPVLSGKISSYPSYYGGYFTLTGNTNASTPTPVPTKTVSISVPASDVVNIAAPMTVSWQGTGFSSGETGRLYLLNKGRYVSSIVYNPYQDYANRSLSAYELNLALASNSYDPARWNLSLAGGSLNLTLRQDLPNGQYQFMMRDNNGTVEYGRSALFTTVNASTSTP